MSAQKLKPFRYRCSRCGHGTTLMLEAELETVSTYCTCCSKDTEDNRLLVRFKQKETFL